MGIMAAHGGESVSFPRLRSGCLKGNIPLVRITDKDAPMPITFSQTGWRQLSEIKPSFLKRYCSSLPVFLSA